MVFDLIVIGGGAAGFYGAVQSGDLYPGLRILIIEKSTRLLSKVRVSGGGRCNVTNHCFDPLKLSRHYPRGEKALKEVFKEYHAKDTVAWFASKGVQLKTEPDGRMFPVTDSSQTIIDCFLREAERLNIRIETGEEVTSIMPREESYRIETSKGRTFESARILIATGGNPKSDAYRFIRDTGHSIRMPIPSLFTFNDTDKRFADLMGVSVPTAEIRIAKTRFLQRGPILITHWGLSGPAVIKLSAWAAEHLHSVNYDFMAVVNWAGGITEDEMRTLLLAQKSERPKQKLHNHPLFDLPQRLWTKLCTLADIPPDRIWGELPLKNLNKLLENLIRCTFHIRGKTTFKEEFVTCGGVEIDEINWRTMESKRHKGIFLAGEVLNVDGETGGFNFQAAWSMAFQAARSLFD